MVLTIDKYIVVSNNAIEEFEAFETIGIVKMKCVALRSLCF